MFSSRLRLIPKTERVFNVILRYGVLFKFATLKVVSPSIKGNAINKPEMYWELWEPSTTSEVERIGPLTVKGKNPEFDLKPTFNFGNSSVKKRISRCTKLPSPTKVYSPL